MAEIADNLGVRSRGGVEAETHANILAATVVIDGLGHADDGGSNPVGGEVFGEMGGVCVGVVAARDDDAVEAKVGARLRGGAEVRLGV